MKGVLYIDGVDAYVAYGISISDVAYDDIVCLPELKPVAFNDWHEKNGIDPDLSSPVVAATSVTIPFYITGEYSGYIAFMLAISNGAYHSFNFATIGATKELRLVSSGELTTVSGLSSFSLTFFDDKPLAYTYSEPSSMIDQLGDYLIDGVDIANYGIRVLRGTMDSIKANPAVKENLKRNISTVPGIQYDNEIVTYKSRTAHIRCLMRARSATEFWRNRNALLHNLTLPGERTLYVSELDKEIPFFYKSCSVNCFFPDSGKFWFEFTLNLEFFKGVIW